MSTLRLCYWVSIKKAETFILNLEDRLVKAEVTQKELGDVEFNVQMIKEQILNPVDVLLNHVPQPTEINAEGYRLPEFVKRVDALITLHKSRLDALKKLQEAESRIAALDNATLDDITVTSGTSGSETEEDVQEFKVNKFYGKGVKVRYNGKLYVCKFSGAFTEPTGHHYWNLMEGSPVQEAEESQNNETNEETQEAQEVQELRSNTIYKKGDIVRFAGTVYVCEANIYVSGIEDNEGDLRRWWSPVKKPESQHNESNEEVQELKGYNQIRGRDLRMCCPSYWNEYIHRI